jgi:hypothetical protein
MSLVCSCCAIWLLLALVAAVTFLKGCCYCRTVVPSLSSCRRCRSAGAVVVRLSMSFVCSCCALWLLLALVAAVNLLKGCCCRCRRAVAVVVPSLSFCRRCCRATVDVVRVLLLCYFALAGFGGCSHCPQGLLLLPNCRCRRAVAVVVPSLSFCRRCCRAAVDVVRVLLLCSLALAGFGGCSHCPQGLLLLPNCRCRRAVAVVVPSLSFCRRCCRAAVDVVRVLLLCSLALAGFGGCSHSPQGLLLLLLMLFFWKILTGPCSDIFLTAATTYSRSHDYKFAVLTLCRNYYLLLL